MNNFGFLFSRVPLRQTAAAGAAGCASADFTAHGCQMKTTRGEFITNLSKMCESFLTLRRLRFPFPFFLVFVFLQNPEKYLIKSSPAFTKSRNYFRLFCETANRFLVFFFGGGDF